MEAAKDSRAACTTPEAEPLPAVVGSYTAAHHAEFMERGYLHLGPLLPPAELESLSKRLDEVMMGTVAYEGVTFQLDPGGA